MKKLVVLFIAVSLGLLSFKGEVVEGYTIGDTAKSFRLKNVDGKMVDLSEMDEVKGFAVIFTCNHCPYSVAYEDRIIELDKKYKSKGYPVIAVNPNNPDAYPDDSFEKMQERAEEKGFTFPYLVDENGKIAKTYGASKTPHVYLLQKEGEELKVAYIGAIDDNYKDPSAVENHYLADAIDALLEGEEPDPSYTKAIGCSIKTKKKDS